MPGGTKPVPTEVKRLMGNPGKRKMPSPGEEPAPQLLDDVPICPEWMGEYGAKEWDRVAPVLVRQRLLSEADVLTFAAYCANVDLLVKSVMEIETHGTTILGARGEVRNPALASFAQATTALRSLAAEFGMTPSSRSRIKLPGDDGETLDDLMNDDSPEDAE